MIIKAPKAAYEWRRYYEAVDGEVSELAERRRDEYLLVVVVVVVVVVVEWTFSSQYESQYAHWICIQLVSLWRGSRAKSLGGFEEAEEMSNRPEVASRIFLLVMVVVGWSKSTGRLSPLHVGVSNITLRASVTKWLGLPCPHWNSVSSFFIMLAQRHTTRPCSPSQICDSNMPVHSQNYHYISFDREHKFYIYSSINSYGFLVHTPVMVRNLEREKATKRFLV